MKKDRFIQNTFADTTVDVQRIYSFLYEHVFKVACAADDRESKLLENRDYCQDVSWWYILGQLETTNCACEEIGLFLEFEPRDAARLVVAFFERIEQHLLTEQWYEFMPRYHLLRQKIREEFNI